MLKKMYFKVIAIIVLIMMLLNFIPISVFAEEIQNMQEENTISENTNNDVTLSNDTEEQNSTNETSDDSSSQDNTDIVTNDDSEKTATVEIKGELVDKREENVKYFLMSDNTIKAEIYQEPVHYQKDGKWIDIDNSLSQTSDEDDGQQVDENKENNFKVKFAKKAKDNKLVSIKSDKLKLKWSLIGANKVPMQKISNNLNEESDPTILKNISSGVKYLDIMKDMDIEYIVKSQDVKENIILKTKQATQNKLIFNLDIEDLEAKLNEDNTISIYNENNEEVSRINAPYMYDSNQEYSDKVQVSLSKNKKNYTVEIKPDDEWLNAPERVYPITIDPTVQTSLYYQDIQDTFIHPGDSTSDAYERYHAHILRVGNRKGTVYRSVVKFNLPTINAGDQVIDAKLNLCDYYKTTEWTPPTQSRQIDVYKVTDSITNDMENSVTWDNTSTKIDAYITDYNMYQFDYNNQGKDNTWNVTPIVKDWYVTGNNYGLMLKEDNEQYSDQSDAYYFSANTSVVYENYRPVISITYRNQSGLEDYWSFHTQDVGRAGTSHVNDYNGNLVITNGDVTTPGNRMPSSIYHVYNSNDYTTNIGYGKGWRLNLSQSLTQLNINNKDYVKYTDEDGTQHYFVKDGDPDKYVDEDGLGLKLTFNYNWQEQTLTDKTGNKLLFQKRADNKWCLYKIIDTNNNTNTISFIDGTDHINQVTDAAGTKVTLNWNGDQLSSITDNNGDNIIYQYDGNGHLGYFVFSDSKSAEYLYDSGEHLFRAKDVDTSIVYYEYKPGNPYRISSVHEESTKDTAGRLVGNYLNFDYGSNSTTITDSKGYSNVYSFNNQGNLSSISDFGNTQNTDLSSQNNINNAYGQAYKFGTEGVVDNKLKLESKLNKQTVNMLPNPSFERTDNWLYGSNGTFNYTTEKSYIGSQSIKVKSTNGTANVPSNVYMPISVEKGKKYTFSAYVATSGISNANGKGATVFVDYITDDNLKQRLTGDFVNGTKDWNRYTYTFEFPSNAASNTAYVCLGIIGEIGDAYFDCAQLEEGETANSYNLIENSSFDNAFVGWNGNSECDTSVNGDGDITHYSGNRLLRLVGDTSKKKEIYQRVNVSGKKGDIFSLSAWARTKSAQHNENKTDKMILSITRTNNTYQELTIDVNADSKNWQYLSDQIMADSDYTSVCLYMQYAYNVNYTYYDNISLLKEDFGQSYSYDKNGNLVTTQDKAKQNSTMQYSGSNELLKETDAKGGSFVYEYDSNVKNRLLSATNNSKVTYAFTYDQFGNATSSTISNKDKVTTDLSNELSYYIRSKSSGLYLSVDSARTTNSTNVIQYLCRGSTSQKWKIVDNGDGYYTLLPIHISQNVDNIDSPNDMVLDLNVAAKNNIEIYSNNHTDCQKFKLIKNTDGSFKIKCKNNESDKVLTVLNDSKELASNISEEKDENKESQSFYFEDINNDETTDKSILESGEVFYLKNKSSNMYVDYAKDSNGNITDSNNTKLVQRESTRTDSQKWRISRLDNGEYKLTPLASITGRSIDVSCGITDNDSQLQVYDYQENNTSQQWTIKKNIDGTYSILSKRSNDTKCMEIQAASQVENASVTLYDANGTDAQKWYIEPANMVNVNMYDQYILKDKNSNKYVGVNNSNVELVADSTTAQKWGISKLNNGYYTFIATDKGTSNNQIVMDIAGGGTSSGTNVDVYSSNSTYAQQFEIVPYGDGTFYIKPRNALGVATLDVSGAGTSIGNNIQIWTTTKDVKQQRFYLEKLNGSESEYIESKAEYNSSGNFVKNVTDARGQKTTYNYDFNDTTKAGTGTLTGVTDAKGTTTSYTYDNLKRMTSVIMNADNKTYQNSYTYDNDKLSTITHNGFSYNFTYDRFGNTQKIQVAANTLVTNEYGDNNGTLNKTTYGNGQAISYTYDRFERITRKLGTNGSFYYSYDNKGNLGSIRDDRDNTTTKYIYDLANRLVKTNVSNGFQVQYGYDLNSNINKVTSTLNGTTNETTYNLDSDNKPTSVKIDTDKYLVYNYDKLSRLHDKKIQSGTNSYSTNVTYVNDTKDPLKTTTLLESITNKNSVEAKEDKISYTYDANGNIETISKNGVLKQKYYYDKLNELIREDNVDLNQTLVYTYDVGGNMLSKITYGYTTATSLTGVTPQSTKTYSYDGTWKDKLVSYNLSPITYDEIGNMTKYNGDIYAWQNGRQLTSITATGKNIQYKYNDSGIRTSKTVNGTTTNYYLDGDKVIYEVTGNNKIYYTYDTDDNLIGFKYNNDQYYYVRNGQGDIIGILDNSLNNVISYTYDTWGKLLSIRNASGQNVTNDTTSIGYINQYRYRGYRYDNETSMYYLNSRYYNPDLCRFINTDDTDTLTENLEYLTDKNLYSYCDNNPVMRIDDGGDFWDTILDIASIGFSAYDFVKNPSLVNAGYLAWDIGAAFIPFVPGSYAAKGMTIVGKTDCISSGIKAIKNLGRKGKQPRLRELVKDDKLSSALRGEIKRDINLIKKGKRKTIRVPQGYQLAHKRKYEARKGYGYEKSNLQMIKNHRLQHKYDNNGRSI